MIWNHPFETTIKNWLFGVPGPIVFFFVCGHLLWAPIFFQHKSVRFYLQSWKLRPWGEGLKLSLNQQKPTSCTGGFPHQQKLPLMEEIPNNHLEGINLVNNGIKLPTNLVLGGFLNHQQYWLLDKAHCWVPGVFPKPKFWTPPKTWRDSPGPHRQWSSGKMFFFSGKVSYSHCM